MPPFVTIYCLEMTSPELLRPSARPAKGFSIERPERDGRLNNQLYRAAGVNWNWTDRLVWSDEQWEAYARQPTLETWIAKLDSQLAGYFELDCQPHGQTEIAYFGLLPDFIGRGLGGQLLSAAIERAWSGGARRVWLHTCTYDHPRAVANYQARGMTIYHTQSVPVRLLAIDPPAFL